MKNQFHLFLITAFLFAGLAARADTGATDWGSWSPIPGAANIEARVQLRGQRATDSMYSWAVQFHNDASQDVSFRFMIDDANVTSEPPPDSTSQAWGYGGAKAAQDSEVYYGIGGTTSPKNCKVFLNNVQYGNGSASTTASDATAAGNPATAGTSSTANQPAPSDSNPRIQNIQNQTAAATTALQSIGQSILDARRQGREERQREEVQKWNEEQAAAEANAAQERAKIADEINSVSPDNGVSTVSLVNDEHVPSYKDLSAAVDAGSNGGEKLQERLYLDIIAPIEIPKFNDFDSMNSDQLKTWLANQLSTYGTFVSVQKGFSTTDFGDTTSLLEKYGGRVIPDIQTKKEIQKIKNISIESNLIKYTTQIESKSVSLGGIHDSVGKYTSSEFESTENSQVVIPLSSIEASKIQVKLGRDNLNYPNMVSINAHRIDQSEENTMWDVWLISTGGDVFSKISDTAGTAGSNHRELISHYLSVSFEDKAAALKFAAGLKALLDPSSIKASQASTSSEQPQAQNANQSQNAIVAQNVTAEAKVAATQLSDQAAGKAKNSDWDGAIMDSSKAIELNPNMIAAYYVRAVAEENKGEFDNAITDYSKVIERRPKVASFYYNRGCAKKSKGDLDGAIADFYKAIELKPDYTEAKSSLESTLKAKN